MLCNKCRVSQPYQGDSWCLACSAVEALSSELRSRWELPGLREAAEESIISTARQVKALRKLSVGLAAERAAAKSKEPARQAEAALSTPRVRSPLPRSASRASRGEAVKKEPSEKDEGESEEGEEQESYSEEEGVLPGASLLPARPAGGGDPEREDRRSKGSRPPPEPEGPPPHRRSREEEGLGAERKRRKKHRGGARHKRLSRLVDRPDTRVHRAFSQQETEGHARRKTWWWWRSSQGWQRRIQRMWKMPSRSA